MENTLQPDLKKNLIVAQAKKGDRKSRWNIFSVEIIPLLIKKTQSFFVSNDFEDIIDEKICAFLNLYNMCNVVRNQPEKYWKITHVPLSNSLGFNCRTLDYTM